jgi:hypothetical protein
MRASTSPVTGEMDHQKQWTLLPLKEKREVYNGSLTNSETKCPLDEQRSAMIISIGDFGDNGPGRR